MNCHCFLLINKYSANSCYIKYMVKIESKNKSPFKKITKIILIVLLTPIALIIIGIAIYFGTKPIFDKFDHDKFITLDSQMQGVFKKLKATSNGADDWKYDTVCSPIRTGWMTTGVYNCLISISTQKVIPSVQELNMHQNKYFPVIDTSSELKQIDVLNPESPSDFGKKFVVSSAEKNYTEVESGIKCNYSILLYQDADKRSFESDSYGSDIIAGVGKLTISIRCEETARNHWYDLVQDTSSLIP